MAVTSSFLTSTDEIIRAAERPRGGFVVELVDASGVRHTTSPRFVQVVEDLFAALDAGKVVHFDVEEALVSAERAAEMLGVSRPTVYAWQDRGRLARVDQANRRMVPTTDIERYLREQQERQAWRASVMEAAEPDEQTVAAAQRTFAGALDLGRDATAAAVARRRTRAGGKRA